MSDLQNVKGLPELKQLFRQISDDIANKVIRTGPSAGARALRDVFKATAPLGKAARHVKGQVIQPGTLRRSAFYFFDRGDSPPGQAVFVVSFRSKQATDAYYAYWLSRGHKIVPRRSSQRRNFRTLSARRAASNTSVPPNPFFEQTISAQAAGVADIMGATLEVEARKAINARGVPT